MTASQENTTVRVSADSSPSMLPVFHGTRRSLADSILEHGFRPLPVADQIAKVAERHNVRLDALTAHLEEHHRFTHLDDRPGTVSMVADSDRAGSWANRAPEAAWDALRSAYDLLNPDAGDEWNQSGPGRFWVLAQQLIDPPVVIGVAVPVAALQSWSFSTGRTALELIAEVGAEGFAKRYTKIPEWRADADLVTAVAVHEVPARLDRYDIIFMADVDPAAFSEDAARGVWGEPEGYDTLPWWSFTEIWGRLSEERRAELEAIAGHSLSSVGTGDSA
jgi:hypothetical protein